MSLKQFAKIFGVVFILFGILGFIPGITTDQGMLLGIFHVNALHNLFHIISGAVAYGVSRKSTRASKLYFQIFGIIYGVIAFLGFGKGDQDLFGCIANNRADAWLHLVIAIVALYLGFLYKKTVE
jgi:hypothetical protein